MNRPHHQLPTNLSAERNKKVIGEIIAKFVNNSSKIVEVASGTGQHGHWFCSQHQKISWQPSEMNKEGLDAITKWQEDLGQENFKKPFLLDCLKPESWYQLEKFDFLVNINMIHISPWEATVGLFQNSKNILKSGGYIYLYGPFIQKTVETTPSNLEFNSWLHSKDKKWGLRKLDEVEDLAKSLDFRLAETISMPANNLSVIFRAANWIDS